MPHTVRTSLADPDELLLSCRPSEAKLLLEEAITTLRAGAYGSCIAKTWQAVLIDGVSKIRKLAARGEDKAQIFVKDFDSNIELRRTDEITADKAMMDLEKRLLDVLCGGYQLLSGYERMDLERLRQDRNRCEHISYHDPKKLFTPSPELARLHVRNAVEAILSRPAFRGQIAASKLLETLKNEEFPAQPIAARMHISRQDLLEMDEEALEIVASALFTDLFSDDIDALVSLQRISALSAIEFHGGNRLQPILETAVQRFTDAIDSVDFARILLYTRFMPWMWSRLPQRTQHDIEEHLRSVSLRDETDLMCWATAMQIDQLIPIAINRLNEIEIPLLLDYRAFIGEPLLIDVLLHHLEGSDSFIQSRRIFRLLRHTKPSEWNRSRFDDLSSIIRSNDQVSRATGLSTLLSWLFERCSRDEIGSIDEWSSLLTGLPFDADEMTTVIEQVNTFAGVSS